MFDRPILFLDIDGVLNTREFLRVAWFRCDHSRVAQIDPAKVTLLQQLVDRTGCDIVVSSTWRYMLKVIEFRELFSTLGFTGRIRDRTPLSEEWDGAPPRDAPRGLEIAEWLKVNNYDGKFAIVDDAEDMVRLERFCVRTDFGTGLQQGHVDQLIKLLGEKTS
jgi:hypothetical protein